MVNIVCGGLLYAYLAILDAITGENLRWVGWLKLTLFEVFWKTLSYKISISVSYWYSITEEHLLQIYTGFSRTSYVIFPNWKFAKGIVYPEQWIVDCQQKFWWKFPMVDHLRSQHNILLSVAATIELHSGQTLQKKGYIILINI